MNVECGNIMIDKMWEAAEKLDFERAVRLRDRIKRVEKETT